MRKLSRTIRGLGLLVVLCGGSGLWGAVPDWVRQAAAEKLPAYDAETDGVVLLDETTITALSPDEYLEHRRRVVSILRPEGRREARFEVYFRGKDKVTSIHAWSIDRTGREYEVKDKEFAERGVSEGFELYTDNRMRMTTTPGADPGSVHAFEYEVRRHSWLNQLDQEFQEEIPVHESRFTVQLPEGWEYKDSWVGTPVIPVVVGQRFTWTLRDLAAIEKEPMRPAQPTLSRRLAIGLYPAGQETRTVGSWEAIGRWENQLTVEQKKPSPGITSKARELVAGKTDFDGKARALTSFLQKDIRYVAIEVGIGGWQPHAAADVYRARYGDCKDKATLLSSMLHEVGIESAYLLISTYRGMAHPDLPAIVFNHAILAIEVPTGVDTSGYQSLVTGKNGKRYLIFDPTDYLTPFGDLRGELQDSYALLVTDAGGELIHTPLQSPDTNELTRTGRFALGGDGELSGEVVESRSGDHAAFERAALMYSNDKQRVEHLEQRLNRSLKGFTVQSVDTQQLDELQQRLVTTVKFTAPGYSQVRGTLLLLRPRVLGEKGFALDRKPRRYPFEFERASKETDSFEIDLPKDYVVDDVPNPVKIDAKFASYESKIEVAGSKLKYTREFVRRDVLIAPERTEELRKFLGAIGADESAVVVLKHVQ